MRTRTDEELVELLNAGRPEALDELYRRHAGKLLVFCARTMNSPQAEDVVHDVFARVIEASRQFDAARGPFRVWLYRIARNRCIDLARRGKKVDFVPLEREAEAHRGEGGAPLENVIAADREEAVRRCLETLPGDGSRRAVVLYYLFEKVYREVGEVLGVSTSMAQKRVREAKEMLRRCLRRKGVAV